MENPMPKTNFTPTRAVKNAIENSELLLVHATEYGLDITKEQIGVLSDAKQALENNDWTKEIEIEFWMIYKELSKLIKPVNIDCLKASQ